MGKIRIENMCFKAYHGVYPIENEVGGDFVIDVLIETSLDKAGKSDALEDTYDYSQVYIICKNEMAIISKLIEHVAYRIRAKISNEMQIQQEYITVKITKLHPPIEGFNGKVSVEL